MWPRTIRSSLASFSPTVSNSETSSFNSASFSFSLRSCVSSSRIIKPEAALQKSTGSPVGLPVLYFHGLQLFLCCRLCTALHIDFRGDCALLRIVPYQSQRPSASGALIPHLPVHNRHLYPRVAKLLRAKLMQIAIKYRKIRQHARSQYAGPARKPQRTGACRRIKA